MKLFVFLCLIISAFAAPVPDSDSSEVAAHANEALRLMELFRMYQRQGLANPFLPAADAPAGPAAAVAINVPVQQAAAIPAGDDSDEETEGGNPGPAVGVAPLNSDEEEEVEEVEATEVEPAVAEPAEGTAAPPAAATEPAVVDVAVDAAPVDDVVVDVPPVDVAAVDIAPEVAADAAGPAAADIPAAADVPAVGDTVAADAAENEVTGGVADPAPL